MVNEAEGTREKLEQRSLFTNYRYIKKSSFLPVEVIFNNDNPVEYTETTENDDNVLNYLKDYFVLDIKDKNKLVQYICHWGYPVFGDQTFNLYDGYKYDYGEIQSCTSTLTENTVTYKLSEIPYTNSISIPYLRDSYGEGKGDLTWVYPSKILWLEGSVQQIKYIIVNKILYQGITSITYQNTVTTEKLNKVWNTNIEDNSKVCCVYIHPNTPTDVETILDSLHVPYVQITLHKTYLVMDGVMSIIFTNDLSELPLRVLISKTNNSNNTNIQSLNSSLKHFEDSITQGNDGEFYGFRVEIGVGKDDLNNNIYYKLNTKSTYVYRNDGTLVPSIKPDDGLNFDYYYDVWEQEIVKVDYDEQGDPVGIIADAPEISLQHLNKTLVVPSIITFNNSQPMNPDLSPAEPLSEIIKEELKTLFGIQDDDLIDYIYKLYYSEFTYEYDFENNEIKYLIKLTLI